MNSLIGLIVVVMLAIGASARAEQDNPFRQGVERIVLSDDERQSLLDYADTSKSRLDEALDDARGKSLAEARRIYRLAMIEVVQKSFVANPRTELLMRHALNQALELTYGTPNPSGSGVTAPGVLVGTSNRDLLTLILEDSIRLAMGYYVDDRAAAQTSALIDLPFTKFATQRLALAREWLASVTEPQLQHRAIYFVLSHWLNTTLRADSMHRARFAEELTEVDAALESCADYSGANLRRLRRLLRTTIASLNEKFKVDGVSLTINESPVRTTSDSRFEPASPVVSKAEPEAPAALPAIDASAHQVSFGVNGYGIVRNGDGMHYGTSLRLKTEASDSIPRGEFDGRFDFNPARGLDRVEIDAGVGFGATTHKSYRDSYVSALAVTLHLRQLQALNYSEWSMQYDVGSFQVRKPFRAGKVNGDYTFGLRPSVGVGGASVNGKDSSGSSGPPGYLRLRGSVGASLQLGELGRIRDQASYDYTHSYDYDFQDFSNELEVKRLGGSHYGINWTYDAGKVTTDEGVTHRYSQHLFGVKREF